MRCVCCPRRGDGAIGGGVMKRVLACVILCLMLLGLTACGGGDVGEVGILAVDSEIYTSVKSFTLV